MNLLWLYSIPNWAFLLLIVASTLAVGWIGLFGLRRWVSHLHGEHNHNEVVSYFLAAVVLFYAVMVGLIAVGIWEQFSATDEKVALEASSLAALYRDVGAYPEPARSHLQADLRSYTRNVIEVSWPLQRRRMIPWEWKFQADLASFEPGRSSEAILDAETMRTYNNLVELRRMRLHSVQSGLPSVVWVVVVLGAVITLSVSWFFKTVSFTVHFWMVTLDAVLLGLIIWLLVVLDHPFLGRVSIGPEPFKQVYNSLMTGGH